MIPAAIGGDSKKRHGIILAKSPVARAMGVTTGKPVATALRKCPNLTLFPPDFKIYTENSAALMELLNSYSPTLQQFSIDEAFLDMTQTIHLFGDLIAIAQKLGTVPRCACLGCAPQSWMNQDLPSFPSLTTQMTKNRKS